MQEKMSTSAVRAAAAAAAAVAAPERKCPTRSDVAEHPLPCSIDPCIVCAMKPFYEFEGALPHHVYLRGVYPFDISLFSPTGRLPAPNRAGWWRVELRTQTVLSPAG